MKTNSEQLPVNKTFKSLMLLLTLVTIFLLSSCSSGWSCQKRYVNSGMKLSPEYIKKHQKGNQSFDKYILKKNVQTQNKNV